MRLHSIDVGVKIGLWIYFQFECVRNLRERPDIMDLYNEEEVNLLVLLDISLVFFPLDLLRW